MAQDVLINQLITQLLQIDGSTVLFLNLWIRYSTYSQDSRRAIKIQLGLGDLKLILIMPHDREFIELNSCMVSYPVPVIGHFCEDSWSGGARPIGP